MDIHCMVRLYCIFYTVGWFIAGMEWNGMEYTSIDDLLIC